MKTTATIVLSILGLVSVASSQTIPLEAGLRWEYVEPGGSHWTALVGDPVEFNGATCFEMAIEITAPYPDVFDQYWSKDDGGDVFYHGGVNDDFSTVHEPPVLFYDVPFHSGKTWTTVSYDGLQTREHTFVVEELEDVTVPAGTFAAWRIAYYIDGFPVVMHVADDVGRLDHGIFELLSFELPVRVEARSLSAVKRLFD